MSIININNKAVPKADRTKINEPWESSASPTNLTFDSTGMLADESQFRICSIFSAVLKPSLVFPSTI